MKDGKMTSQDQYLLQCFAYDGLAAELQEVVKPFYDLAQTLFKVLPDNANRTAAVQKLLEAKESAVRASFV